MSRQARLSFIRANLYDAVRRRIMLGMDIDYCQLSKLYAYNGLMLSSGTRIDGVDIDRPHRVIVVENRTRTEQLVSVITVEADGSQDTMRNYYRVEKKTDVPITCFDGEGLISPRFATQIDRVLRGEHVHTSFQIRLPYVKGMLHQVDFHSFLTDCGACTITDLWGVEHRVKDVDVILTRSMCKSLGWMAECGMGWLDYWDAFRRNYDIARFEKYKSLENRKNIPLLMIPAAEPRIRSARDWEARFEAVRDTFSSQVGQICNAALDRSIIACNDNSDDEERQRCREETELLPDAVLPGLTGWDARSLDNCSVRSPTARPAGNHR